MSDTLDTEIGNLTANVAQLTTVDESAVALMNGPGAAACRSHCGCSGRRRHSGAATIAQ